LPITVKAIKACLTSYLIFAPNIYFMDDNMISLVISSVALLISIITFYLFNKERGKKKQEPAPSDSSRPLQLQAYERLVVLADRISLPSLISRANQPGLNAKEMQSLLLESIKQEVEYNTSQQIYVSAPAWDAIRNLKDQNMLIINQVAATLPVEAKGIDLNKKLLEFVMNQQKGSLHTIVSEALNYEAKKLMQ